MGIDNDLVCRAHRIARNSAGQTLHPLPFAPLRLRAFALKCTNVDVFDRVALTLRAFIQAASIFAVGVGRRIRLRVVL